MDTLGNWCRAGTKDESGGGVLDAEAPMEYASADGGQDAKAGALPSDSTVSEYPPLIIVRAWPERDIVCQGCETTSRRPDRLDL